MQISSIFAKTPLRIHENTPFQARNYFVLGSGLTFSTDLSRGGSHSWSPKQAFCVPHDSSYRFTTMIASLSPVG